MDPFKRRKLGTSNVMLPQLGFGGAPLGELFVKVPEIDSVATMAAAWDGGIRYFDTAPWYGRGLSEHRIGQGLYDKPRDEFTVSTKVGRILHAPLQPGWRPTDLGRRAALRAPLRLQLRRGDAELRGQPAAARPDQDRHPRHPRPRLPVPPHRRAGERLSHAARHQAATGRSPS